MMSAWPSDSPFCSCFQPAMLGSDPLHLPPFPSWARKTCCVLASEGPVPPSAAPVQGSSAPVRQSPHAPQPPGLSHPLALGSGWFPSSRCLASISSLSLASLPRPHPTPTPPGSSCTPALFCGAVAFAIILSLNPWPFGLSYHFTCPQPA